MNSHVQFCYLLKDLTLYKILKEIALSNVTNVILQNKKSCVKSISQANSTSFSHPPVFSIDSDVVE